MSVIDPVSRVAGAPAAPVTPAPAAPRPAPAGAGGLLRNRTVQLAGLGVLVVGFALFQSRGSSAPADDGPDSFELDTRDTDLYNDLQPELEQIADRLDGLENPRPIVPTPITPRPPQPPAPAPKPAPPKTVPPLPMIPSTQYVGPYVIQKGDTLASIGKKHGTTAWGIFSYGKNTDILEYAAKNRGQKSSQGGKLLYPGTVIYIPNARHKKAGPTTAEAMERLKRIKSKFGGK
jgi:nucleoid-associated protein YgaU